MLTTQEQQDAYQFTQDCLASHFETRLMALLEVADRQNAQKIMDAWGEEITRMANLYNHLKAREEQWEGVRDG